jgi:hypothetical protein
MMGFALLAAGIGFLVSFAQFRAMVLLPSFCILSISLVVFSVTTHLSGWQAASAGIMGTVGLEVGYFLAILERVVRQNSVARAKSSSVSLSRFI